jgi:uncharacterized membrane protein YjjP (DUF1212 family)
MALMKNEWLIPVGVLCLAAAILSDRFLLMIGGTVLDFVVGILAGVSIVLNFAGLYRMRKSKD